MSNTNYVCDNMCCNIITCFSIYKTFHKRNNKKAGIFIYDPSEDRVLLVQSSGLYWGPPKGTLEETLGETILECAIREVKEETGLLISPQELKGELKIKNKITYFYCERKTCTVEIQKMEGNDANGITWIKLPCLIDLVKNKKMLINKHCQIACNKFLGTKFPEFV